jgi:hypothetical protein
MASHFVDLVCHIGFSRSSYQSNVGCTGFTSIPCAQKISKKFSTTIKYLTHKKKDEAILVTGCGGP